MLRRYEVAHGYGNSVRTEWIVAQTRDEAEAVIEARQQRGNTLADNATLTGVVEERPAGATGKWTEIESNEWGDRG